jgi:hypothetical protein
MRPPGCNLFSAGSPRGVRIAPVSEFSCAIRSCTPRRDCLGTFREYPGRKRWMHFVATGVADDARSDGLGLALDQFAWIARRLSSSCVASARRQRGGISLALCFSRRPSSPATDSFATPRAGDLPGSVQQCVDGIRGARFRAVRRNRAPRRVGRSEAEVPEARR